MYLRHLQLGSFRIWERVDLALGPGPVVLVGRNGEGKTNLVEAVGYLATLSSHRVSSDAPLVRTGAEQAVIRAALRREDRELLVEVEINPGRANRVRLNRSALPRPRELLGLVRTVVFAPEDLALVRGDPTERRRFLDELLVTRTPRLAGVRSDYDRVLRQRNALLKTARMARGEALATLDVWDAHLVELGGQLSAALRERIAERRRDEVDRGMTLVGPHRDDLVLHLGAVPAKGFASHGESWSLALALKLATFALLRADGEDPVLILDDVFATLDAERRAALASVARSAEQTLITAAVLDDVPPELRGGRVEVGDGTVRVLDPGEVA